MTLTVDEQERVRRLPSRFVPIGIDLSLTATGIRGRYLDTVIKSKKTGPARLDQIADKVLELVHGNKANIAVIEGYSYGSFNGGERLGELGGVVRTELWRRDIQYVEVAPNSLKKYATGKGNASKDAVLVSGVHRSHIQFVDNNACDAWWLWQMGEAHYMTEGPWDVIMPKEHQKALAAVAWPDSEVQVA